MLSWKLVNKREDVFVLMPSFFLSPGLSQLATIYSEMSEEPQLSASAVAESIYFSVEIFQICCQNDTRKGEIPIIFNWPSYIRHKALSTSQNQNVSLLYLCLVVFVVDMIIKPLNSVFNISLLPSVCSSVAAKQKGTFSNMIQILSHWHDVLVS